VLRNGEIGSRAGEVGGVHVGTGVGVWMEMDIEWAGGSLDDLISDSTLYSLEGGWIPYPTMQIPDTPRAETFELELRPSSCSRC